MAQNPYGNSASQAGQYAPVQQNSLYSTQPTGATIGAMDGGVQVGGIQIGSQMGSCFEFINKGFCKYYQMNGTCKYSHENPNAATGNSATVGQQFQAPAASSLYSTSGAVGGMDGLKQDSLCFDYQNKEWEAAWETAWEH